MKLLLAISIFISLACSQAFAATLDFTTLPKGTTTKPLKFPTVAISESSGGTLFVYGKGDFGMPATGGVCALQSDFSCTGDVSLLFVGPVSNLKFTGYYASTSDQATISAYAGDTLLSLLLVSGNADSAIDIDFTGVSGISRVEIASSGIKTGRGIAYGDFNFDVDPPDSQQPAPPPDDFLTFDALPGGVNDDVIDLGPVIVTETSGGQIFIYRTGDYSMPQNGGLCAFTTGTCMGDLLLEFEVPILDLIFSGFFAKTTDSAFVSLFDGETLVYRERFFGNSAGTIRFDFREFGKLTTLLIEDSSDKATKGIAFGNFNYNIYKDVPAPVPLPASVMLLMGGLLSFGFLGVARRRRVPAT